MTSNCTDMTLSFGLGSTCWKVSAEARITRRSKYFRQLGRVAGLQAALGRSRHAGNHRPQLPRLAAQFQRHDQRAIVVEGSRGAVRIEKFGHRIAPAHEQPQDIKSRDRPIESRPAHPGPTSADLRRRRSSCAARSPDQVRGGHDERRPTCRRQGLERWATRPSMRTPGTSPKAA
jgi:hypothetical protein